MSADRSERRSDSGPEELYYFKEGVWAVRRAANQAPQHHPPSIWTQPDGPGDVREGPGRGNDGNGARHRLPAQAERPRPAGDRGDQGPADGWNLERRPASRRAEGHYPEVDQGGRGRVNGGNDARNGARRPPPPTRAEPLYFGQGRGSRGGSGGRHAVRRPPPTRAERLNSADVRSARPRPGVSSWETGAFDTGLYERQMAGISALISLANEVTVATRYVETIPASAEERLKPSKLSIISRLRQDEMIWNSLFLIMSTGLQAGTGFLFWIFTARLFSVSDVGKGSALISGAGLIGILALVGLNSGMARYLPDARNRDALINSGIFVVAVLGTLGGLLYILLTPVVAPELSFVEKSPVLTIGFALITSAAAVNTLTDVIFIASRKAKYTFFVDGVIGGFGKIALVALMTGAGAYGLFLASATGILLAATASVLLILTALRVRIDLRAPLKTLKPLIRFSGANYIGTVMNVLTTLIVPIILLDRLGAKSAGYFFVALQLAQIVYTAALALEQTFLTEGSRADADMGKLRRRSLRLLVLFFALAGGIMIGAGRWLLLAFGQPYYHNSYTSLIILVLAAGPVSANYWLQTLLRLAGKLRAIIVANIVGAVATCLCVWIGSSYGLTAVSWGWLGGTLIMTCVAGVAVRDGRARS